MFGAEGAEGKIQGKMRVVVEEIWKSLKSGVEFLKKSLEMGEKL